MTLGLVNTVLLIFVLVLALTLDDESIIGHFDVDVLWFQPRQFGMNLQLTVALGNLDCRVPDSGATASLTAEDPRHPAVHLLLETPHERERVPSHGSARQAAILSFFDLLLTSSFGLLFFDIDISH